MNSDRLSRVWAPGALGVLSVLRIFTGLALLQHGTGKILGFPVAPMFANVQIDSLAGLGGLIELIGGLLFTIGLFTRPVAFSGLPPPPFHHACRQGISSAVERCELPRSIASFSSISPSPALAVSADALIRRK
jgi:hypothetical protein